MSLTLSSERSAEFWTRYTETESGCWEWNRGRFPKGYGAFSVGNRQRGAHRIAFTLAIGPIPDGMLVCHRCDNPPCIRPDHLFLGTDADNSADRSAKGRAWARSGEEHYRSKLTAEDVGFIRANHVSRHPEFGERALARRFGVSQPIIHRILTREIWKSVS